MSLGHDCNPLRFPPFSKEPNISNINWVHPTVEAANHCNHNMSPYQWHSTTQCCEICMWPQWEGWILCSILTNIRQHIYQRQTLKLRSNLLTKFRMVFPVFYRRMETIEALTLLFWRSFWMLIAFTRSFLIMPGSWFGRRPWWTYIVFILWQCWKFDLVCSCESCIVSAMVLSMFSSKLVPPIFSIPKIWMPAP